MPSKPSSVATALSAACSTDHADLAALEAAFRTVVGSARALWPDLGVNEDSLAERLGELVSGSPTPAADLGALHPDIVLAYAALCHDPVALTLLDALVRSASDRAALRGAPSGDLAQHVREQLLFAEAGREPKLTQYSGKGPLGAWLRVLVTRAGLTMQRTENRRTSKLTNDDALAHAPAFETSPELQMLRTAYAGPFRDAFREALRSLPPEDRNMLRLHLSEGLGIDRLAPIYGVHRATAARRLARAKELVLEKTRAALQRTLGIGESDFSSLVGLMLSRVEVSMSFLESGDP